MAIEGIDLSAANPPAQWARVAAAGKRFAWCKVGDGLRGVDALNGPHVAGADAVGMAVGRYLVLAPSSGDAAGQGRRLATMGRPWRPGDLPPALDVEARDDAQAIELARDRAKARVWGESVYDALRAADDQHGAPVVLYTYLAFVPTITGHSSVWDDYLAQHPLWLAAYPTIPRGATVPDSRCPKPPGPWTRVTAWQWAGTVSGVCDGVTGACDLNRFMGTEEEFLTFRRLALSPRPAPDLPTSEPVRGLDARMQLAADLVASLRR